MHDVVPDPGAAVSFLKTLRPAGPWNVSAIDPIAGITSATFVDPSKARIWIERHADHSNIYYGINPAVPGRTGRAKKSETSAIEYLFGDFDADKFAEGHDLYPLPLAERKEAIFRELSATNPPTFIIDTGGGLQALWRLDEPLPATLENVRWAENANRWLAHAFAGGDTGVTDVGRLLRLPGTVNFPDERKRKRGRVAAPARLIHATGEFHDRRLFGQVEAKAGNTDAEYFDVSAIEYVTDLDDLVARYGLSDRTRTIILEGRLPDVVKEPDDSRDKWLMDGACQMVRAGVPVCVVAGVLLNTEWGISGHVYDHKGRTHEAYAIRQATRAAALVAAERQCDVDQMAEFSIDRSALPDDPEPVRTPQPATDIRGWLEQNFVRIGHRDITALPPTRWILEGVVIAEEVSIFGGRGGVGKSLLAWMVAIMIATARTFTWWPAPKRARRVLVISGEDSADEIEKRVAVACKAHGIDRSALGDRFLVKSDRDIKLAVMNTKTGAISRTELWANIREAIRTHDIGLVIVDPVIKSSLGFNESDNSDMNAFFECLRELVVGQEAGVLVVDHFAKGGVGGDQGSVRGASAKIDAARMAGTVTAMTEKEERTLKPPKPRKHYVLFSDAKTNYAEKVGGQWFELVSYEVGNGETRPALVWRPFDKMDAIFDPQHWEHRSAFIRLVADGRDGADKTGLPWRSATKGPRSGRLNDAVADRFSLTIEQAQNWIAAFAKEESIVEFDWIDPSRNVVKCWRVNEDYQTEEDIDILVTRTQGS